MGKFTISCDIAPTKAGVGKPIIYRDERIILLCHNCGHKIAKYKESCVGTIVDNEVYYSYTCPLCGTTIKCSQTMLDIKSGKGLKPLIGKENK